MASGSVSKKRKHQPTADTDLTLEKKKEKRHKKHKEMIQLATPPPEDALSQKRKPKSPQDKGKSRASDHPSEFRIINASIVLSIPPVFASNLRAGVEEMLDSMVMRYIPSLQGVLLAHSNIQFLSKTASIHGECPFAVCNVSFDATVWGPQVAMKLSMYLIWLLNVGKVNLCSPDHISLLVHRTFNASIPRHHIPQDQWSFEYGPAENDPEFGAGRDWDGADESKEADVEMNDSTEPNVCESTQEAESSGHWVHHLTGSKLGDPEGYLEFTVIGLTVANEMLSLQGSIQPDPFSPEHVTRPNMKPSSPTYPRDEASEVEPRDDGGNEEGEEESDEDAFKDLARLVDEARATQKTERHAKEEAERTEKAKKRKRQESHGGEGGEGAQRGKREKKRL